MEKNMNLTELKSTITVRRSHRSYTETLPSEKTLDKIVHSFSELTPLFRDLDYTLRLIEREELRTTMAWFPPMAIALYSDTGEGYLENAGFILGQLDLYLQSLGLGCCFVGMGKPLDIQSTPENKEFVMLLAFGETNDAPRSGEADFTRLDVTEDGRPNLSCLPKGACPLAQHHEDEYDRCRHRRILPLHRRQSRTSRSNPTYRDSMQPHSTKSPSRG